MMLPIEQFALKGAVQSCERYGNGHINETYLVTCPSARYILQKINTNVFKKPDELMQNIESVLRHQRSRVDDPRGCMTLVPTRDGASWYQDESGAYRCYDFVEGSICLDRAESEADFAESGAGFGAFQRMLADFPAHTLHETIPHFHDTPDRYRIFKEAVAADALGRAREVQREIDFALAHEKDAAALMEAGLPLRVTHNDTKLNNVLLDRDTGEAVCVIDLDTVMPGLAVNDFGDSIRFGANHCAEDERDLNKVCFDLNLFDAYTQGFLEGADGALTPAELDYLPWGARLITLECGIRFLTDYLEGDKYFRIHRPGQNLDRCRTQFKLVADMEACWDKMCLAVDKYR